MQPEGAREAISSPWGANSQAVNIKYHSEKLLLRKLPRITRSLLSLVIVFGYKLTNTGRVPGTRNSGPTSSR